MSVEKDFFSFYYSFLFLMLAFFVFKSEMKVSQAENLRNVMKDACYESCKHEKQDETTNSINSRLLKFNIGIFESP